MKINATIRVALVLAAILGATETAISQTPIPPRKIETARGRVVYPCDRVALIRADVVRNQSLAAAQALPNYLDTPSLAGNTWTVGVPAEAFDLGAKPYLVRFYFQNSGMAASTQPNSTGFPYWLDEYHPALTVLTPQQAISLSYVSGPSHGSPCFLKVAGPRGQLGSATKNDIRERLVTDDWPAQVGHNGQYALQLWYFSSTGHLTKKGDYLIKLTSCAASSSNRFKCS